MKRKDAKKELDRLIKLQAELYLKREKSNDFREIIAINIELNDIYYQIEYLEVNYYKYL